MADAPDFIQTIADKRLSITRETELLHSFVRINVKDGDGFNEENEADFELSNQRKKSEGKL